jgi:hypothetical protein
MSQNTPGQNEKDVNNAKAEAKRTAEDLKQEAKQAAHKVSQRVKEGAHEAADEVRRQTVSAVHQQQDVAADKLDSLAQAIRDSGDRLSEENGAAFAGLFERAADSIERFSDNLREQELRDMFENVQNWARRNPTLFLAGSFVAGLLIARLMKGAGSAVAEDMSEDQSDEPAYRPRDVGQSRFSTQYGSSRYSTTPGVGSSGGWEET